nr:GNAT family N-acetyltransferase [Paracoccus sp. S-4012]
MRAAFEATWPPAELAECGGFVVGRGEGAGGRVSSARKVAEDWTEADLASAELQHEAWHQPLLFRVLEGDARLIAALEARGYRAEKPTLILATALDALTGEAVPDMTAFALWPPLAVQRELWSAGAVDAPRQRVMARAPQPKAALLGRVKDRAAGAGFCAVHGDVAMLHGIEVAPGFRRLGVGGAMLRRAAFWAAAHGATRMALAVAEKNGPAIALYRRLGFTDVGRYGYWRRR